MADREPLILLVHRIPYPPNKGDKIRSYHLLRFLAEHYDVHLAAFVDDAADWPHAAALEPLCASLHLQALHPRWARVRGLRGLLTGQPMTLPYYHSARLRRWVTATARRTGAQRVVAFSSAMTPYAAAAGPYARTVLDMVDVDSAKWSQYAERGRGPKAWLYRREGQRLCAYEGAAARASAATTLVSESEAALFRERCPEAAERVHVVANGVDTDYFQPAAERANPYAAGRRVIAFTGAMDYRPNVDAVTWFAHDILPRIRSREPDAVFYIVGTRPTPAVQALAQQPGVVVTGAVADMRPWLQHAALLVAPLRIARGIQNKVLEGFAMARPVLATSDALDGLDIDPNYPLRADSASDFAEVAGDILRARIGANLGGDMRALVQQRYGWTARLQPMLNLIEEPFCEPLPAAGDAPMEVAS